MANVSSSNGLEKRPKLRFPGFDEPWEDTLFSDLYEAANEKNDGSFGVESIISVANMYFKEDARITDEGYLKTYNIFKVGDIAFEGNKSNDFSHGRFVENTIGDGIVSHVFVVFKPLHDTHNLRYWKYAINNESVMGRILARCTKKTTMMTNLVTKDFLNQSIPCPSAQEQDKIASLLDTISKRIELQKLYVESLKKYKRGVTAKLIAAIEEKYPVVRLGDHVTVMRGGSPRPIDAYITNAENGIRWIKIGDALPDQLYISDTKEKIKPEGAKKSRRVYAGDLILSNSMSFGRPYILKVDGCIHDGWLLIRDEEKKFDKRFLCFYLASDVTLAQYKKYAAGSCVNNLNSELVASVEIGMPPIEQQIRMANILEKIDRQVEAASTMYLLLSKLRSSLLQQLFI